MSSSSRRRSDVWRHVDEYCTQRHSKKAKVSGGPSRTPVRPRAAISSTMRSWSSLSYSRVGLWLSGILEQKQVALPHPDDVTGVQLHVFSERFAVPHDRGVGTGAEHGGAAGAVPKETAVPREDVGGEEQGVRLRAVLMVALPTECQVWPSEKQQQVRTVVRRVNGVLCGVVVAALRLLPLRLLSFSLGPRPRRTEALCFGPVVPLGGDRRAVNAILFQARFRALGALRRRLIQTLASILATRVPTFAVRSGLRVRIQEVHLTFTPPQFVASSPRSPRHEGGGHPGAALLQLSSLGVDA
ncbi:hypothetical protein EYF80_035848 [Liparis tanakae]|uniref:Uncharacterized protein n=1 Tax=Liparis tanakae TaxID=230148 RepID=A0A4Z2GL48_9TELE|nr:hypothetical protein EYF80_035848 [Liparis tanakae]